MLAHFTIKKYTLHLLSAWLLCGTLALDARAQIQSGHSISVRAHRPHIKPFYDNKLDAPFKPLDNWMCLDGQVLNMAERKRPTAVLIGNAQCRPCRKMLPTFAALANEEAYAGYDFIYLTSDNRGTIEDELERTGIMNSRVKIVPVAPGYIDSYRLVLGYPTVYFVNSNNIVNLIFGYGAYEGRLDKKNNWYLLLDSMR